MASFRQFVLQAPPIVARGTAASHAVAAGGTWNRYPAAHRNDATAGD